MNNDLSYISDSFNCNFSGHLTIGGIDTLLLAKQYGTPLYVMDENKIKRNLSSFQQSIDKYYEGNGLCCYAGKAFACKQMYRIAKAMGVGIDVVSMGELYTASSVKFNPKKICYHGNNKTYKELNLALSYGVTHIVIDSFAEIDKLDKIAHEMNIKASCMLRLCPGIEAHTHSFIQTGQIDSKYGFSTQLGTAMQAVKYVLAKKNLTLLGIHCHIGSQIFDIEPFCHAAEVMLKFISDVKIETGYEIDELNLGGGFGINYTDEDNASPYEKYMEEVSSTVKTQVQLLDIKAPFIILEPGRSIVANAGLTLYTVGNIKEIPDIRTYVAVDGGMTDNIRYALYGSKYEFLLANKADKEKTDSVTIAGRCCESGDLLGEDVMLPKCEEGDILATLCTGAYCYSMSSNYNRVAKPPVVFVNNGESYLGVKRETMEDLIRNDI